MPLPISLVVITLDAASSIGACLRSAPFAADKVVIDSGSTDGTQQLAEAAGARVIHNKWPGFGPQKQVAVAAAQHDWVLCLDADEWLSPGLAAEIPGLPLADAGPAVWRMRRCSRFMGRFLRHGRAYPDWSPRLFDRRRARWSDDLVHEVVHTAGPIADLRHDLLHDPAESLTRYVTKQNRYTDTQAEGLAVRGKRAGAWRFWLNPYLRLLDALVLRRGLLDGVPGIVHALVATFGSTLKYAKLRELQRLAVERRNATSPRE